MSERMTSGPFEFDQKQVTDIRKIGDRALSIVYDDYGSGYPEFMGGDRVRLLPFHGVKHSEHVAHGAVRVGARYGVNGSGQELLNTYGKAHDIRQLNGRGIDESLSAEWLEEQMLNEGLPPLAARFGRLAVLGTLPLFNSEGVLIDQQVNHMDFESWEEELFAKSTASGDFSTLYTPFSPLESRLLYAEINGISDMNQEPPTDGLVPFQERQLALLLDYRYPLTEAEGVLATHKRQVLDYQHFVYNQLVNQRLESWWQLIHQDQAFINDPEAPLSYYVAR